MPEYQVSGEDAAMNCFCAGIHACLEAFASLLACFGTIHGLWPQSAFKYVKQGQSPILISPESWQSWYIICDLILNN